MPSERELTLRDGFFTHPEPDHPDRLPHREISSRSSAAALKGRTLLSQRGILRHNNSAERGMYHSLETPRVYVEQTEKDGYEIWLETTSKSARSFQIMASRNGKERVLYRFKRNRVKDGTRHGLDGALQFENLETHLHVLQAHR